MAAVVEVSLVEVSPVVQVRAAVAAVDPEVVAAVASQVRVVAVASEVRAAVASEVRVETAPPWRSA